jgi:2-methylisocitrate lyase-like PEP mutase family enzyme
MSTGASRLREALDRGEQLVAPGVYDALTAKGAVSLGFNAVDVGGFASAATLGLIEPLMTMTEQVEVCRRIAEAIPGVPVIGDGHTGYGDAIHITRAVREFERAGVAAIHVEDQVFPKRASYHRGTKQMVSIAEMKERIGAACSARDEMVIIARTDARAAAGGSLEETISRCRAYAAAGADVLMPMPHGGDEARVVRDAIPVVPLAWVGGLGKFAPGEEVPTSELAQLGYQIAMYGVIGLVTGFGAVMQLYEGLRDRGVPDVADLDRRYHAIMEVLGVNVFYAIEDEDLRARGMEVVEHASR